LLKRFIVKVYGRGMRIKGPMTNQPVLVLKWSRIAGKAQAG
jgi:hypothetical protein